MPIIGHLGWWPVKRTPHTVADNSIDTRTHRCLVVNWWRNLYPLKNSSSLTTMSTKTDTCVYILHGLLLETRVIGLHFVAAIVWVYLHSNLCSGLQKTHLFCTRVRIGRSRSSKVDDFGTNRKRVCDFLCVPHCVIFCTVSEIRRLIG